MACSQPGRETHLVVLQGSSEKSVQALSRADRPLFLHPPSAMRQVCTLKHTAQHWSSRVCHRPCLSGAVAVRLVVLQGRVVESQSRVVVLLQSRAVGGPQHRAVEHTQSKVVVVLSQSRAVGGPQHRAMEHIQSKVVVVVSQSRAVGGIVPRQCVEGLASLHACWLQ